MKHRLHTSIGITIIIISLLFSCASTKQKQAESGDAVFYYDRGIAYANKGQHGLAISDYTKAIEINPRYDAAHISRGNAYDRKGQHDEAISDYTKALEINPRWDLAYYGRGRAYGMKGQYDLAIPDFTKALEINPRYDAAYYGRGLAYRMKDQYDRAISDYTKALEINPRFDTAHVGRGNAYRMKGQYDQAISDFTKALEINSKLVVAYYGRGYAYDKKGQYKEAISDYIKALEIDPGWDMVHNGIAWLLATAKEPDFRNGEKAVEHAVKACELSDWKKPSHFDALAAAYARIGDFSNAVKWQEKALESPDSYKLNGAQERLNSYREHKPWPSD